MCYLHSPSCGYGSPLSRVRCCTLSAYTPVFPLHHHKASTFPQCVALAADDFDVSEEILDQLAELVDRNAQHFQGLAASAPEPKKAPVPEDPNSRRTSLRRASRQGLSDMRANLAHTGRYGFPVNPRRHVVYVPTIHNTYTHVLAHPQAHPQVHPQLHPQLHLQPAYTSTHNTCAGPSWPWCAPFRGTSWHR